MKPINHLFFSCPMLGPTRTRGAAVARQPSFMTPHCRPSPNPKHNPNPNIFPSSLVTSSRKFFLTININFITTVWAQVLPWSSCIMFYYSHISIQHSVAKILFISIPCQILSSCRAEAISFGFTFVSHTSDIQNFVIHVYISNAIGSLKFVSATYCGQVM